MRAEERTRQCVKALEILPNTVPKSSLSLPVRDRSFIDLVDDGNKLSSNVACDDAESSTWQWVRFTHRTLTHLDTWALELC